MRLSTPLRRGLFALPLAALVFGAALVPPPVLNAQWEVSVDSLAVIASIDCGQALQPVGALGLARMPGDLGTLSLRLRCAG